MRDTNLESVCYQVFRSLLSHWHRSCSSRGGAKGRFITLRGQKLGPWHRVKKVSGHAPLLERLVLYYLQAWEAVYYRGLRVSYAHLDRPFRHTVSITEGVCHSHWSTTLCVCTQEKTTLHEGSSFRSQVNRCVRRLAAARLHRWTNRRHFRSRISLFFSFFFLFFFGSTRPEYRSNQSNLLHGPRSVRLPRRISRSQRRRPVRVQEAAACTDGAQMDRFTVSDFFPSSCLRAVVFSFLGLCASVLCAFCNDQLRWRFPQKVENGVVWPQPASWIFKLCAAWKDESFPFIWNSLKQFHCFMLLERVVKYINTLKHIFMIYGLFRKLCLF